MLWREVLPDNVLGYGGVFVGRDRAVGDGVEGLEEKGYCCLSITRYIYISKDTLTKRIHNIHQKRPSPCSQA